MFFVCDQVRLVRLRETGEVLAMKTMNKEVMIKKNQVAHVRAERNALVSSDNPWVVKLHYSFQDDEQLHLVMDFLPGGDLMTLLIKYDIFPCASSLRLVWLGWVGLFFHVVFLLLLRGVICCAGKLRLSSTQQKR